MWHAIAQQLSEVLAFNFIIREKEHLSDGECNSCYMISDGEERYFVKVNGREFISKFESEIDNLSALLATSTIRVPQPVTCGVTKDNAFLILNYLPTKPVIPPKDAFDFGNQLAMLHQWGEQKEYGYDADTYVGLNLQPNTWHKNWGFFFAEFRIGWQLQLLKEKGLDLGDIDQTVNLVKSILGAHSPKPALLHGNLTANNHALSVSGVISYDPSSYWGDRECDIAIIEAFSGLDDEFFKAYNQSYPLPEGYLNRKSVYQLYYLLCCCNQFGGDYLPQCLEQISQLEK
ncbi:fructosamine kinase family protein [Vibrio rumoiensis]|uniref:Fructosamine kinase n=1 Tax=Vibrio rumoiensis 1S-45 TaxID=1188252 RepID=A0A1E5E6N5_9VIBR|nr:fructosamine kinase family protein [Vibrio rumoiensis]OEF30162.1 hypothetical protein A1QC_00365 [Vibrio rumoiensis 1S-45]